jgi:hypothetical protein
MPKEIIDIVEIAREYINTPLSHSSRDGGYTTRTRDMKEKNPYVYVDDFWRDARRDCHIALQRISGWMPSARTNKELRDRFDALYHRLNERPQVGSRYVINCEDDLRDLIMEHEFSVICGKRGTGKTSALNYWLSLHGEAKLAREKNVAWFKVDASLIYEIWELQNDESKHLCEYLKLYIVSDFLFHSRCVKPYEKYKSDLFCDVLRDIKKRQDSSQHIIAAISIIAGHLDTLTKQKNTKNTYIYFDEHAGSSDIAWIVHAIAVRALIHDLALRDHLTNIYDALTQELNNKNRLTAVIVDGIDSIETVCPQRRYEVLIDQVCNLLSCCTNKLSAQPHRAPCQFNLNNLCNIDKHVRLVLVIRPETLQDIKRKIHYSYDKAHMAAIAEGTVFLPPIDLIVKKKLHAIRDAESLQDDRENMEALLKGDDSISPTANTPYGKLSTLVGEYEFFFRKYMLKIKECVERIYTNSRRIAERENIDFRPVFDIKVWSKQGSCKNYIVEHLFNENIRAFIDNFLNTKLLTSYLKTCPEISRVEDDPFRYLKYLMFNGRVLLNTSDAMLALEQGNPIRRGECFPNVFWFEASAKHWGGLTGIRILQFLNCFNGDRIRYTAAYMLCILRDIFDFDEKNLWNAYRRLVEYGLVDVMTSDKYNEDSDVFRKINGKARITKKGKFFLDFLFIYPEWMYACAIDTPMPDQVANEQYMPVYELPIGPCIESEMVPDSYLEAFMVTLATFSRVIKDKHARQMEIVDRRIEAWNGDMPKDDLQLLRKHLVIPDVFEEIVIDKIRSCAERRQKRNPGQFKAFKQDYFDNNFRRDIEEMRPRKPDISKSSFAGRALIIGISDYRYIGQLHENVANDAEKFEAILTSQQCGYRVPNVVKLVNGDATAERIRRELAALSQTTTRDETVIVYFSGHGGRIGTNGDERMCLLPADYDPATDLGAALESSELISLLDKIHSDRVVVILDACHSGGAGSIKEPLPFKKGFTEHNLTGLTAGGGRVILSSSKHDEVSYAFSDMEHSLFSHFLFEGLGGNGGSEDVISVIDVFKYVSERVPAAAQRRNVCQTPRLLADMTKDFPLGWRSPKAC